MVASCRSARRNSSSVPSAISRPPAITPMRSAMRSATSRICVVMITVSPVGDALAQHALHLPRRAGIEAGQRLVQDDHARPVHQRAGERHLLPHALGESFAALVRVGGKPEPVHQLAARAPRRLSPRGSTARRRIRDTRKASACRRSSARPRPRRRCAWPRPDRAAHRCRKYGSRRRPAAAGPPPCARSWSCRRRSARAANRTRRCGSSGRDWSTAGRSNVLHRPRIWRAGALIGTTWLRICCGRCARN